MSQCPAAFVNAEGAAGLGWLTGTGKPELIGAVRRKRGTTAEGGIVTLTHWRVVGAVP